MKSWSAYLRWGLALLCGVGILGIVRAGLMMDMFGPYGAALGIVGIVALLALIAALLSSELTTFVTAPVARLIDDAFGLHGNLGGKPPLEYRTADYNASVGRWQEALFQYERLLRHYPDDMRSHLGALKSAMRLGLPPAEIEKMRLAAMKAARTPADAVMLRELVQRGQAPERR
jgi:hypothetical protein